MKTSNSVEAYIEKNKYWKKELELLRNTILKTELNESIKWGAPVYDLDGKNVVGLGAFKNHFGVWFFNGVFLKDEQNLLLNAQEGKTKALRQMRFEHLNDINTHAVLAYVKEAIANQKAGKELKPERSSKKVVVPQELKSRLNSSKELGISFKDLSPAKQREYCEYIDSAKREATKESRLDKITPMILEGVGLNDKYKNC